MFVRFVRFKSCDETVKKLCRKKITAPDEPILGAQFTVQQAIAAAIVKRAVGGASDAVKLIREILDSETANTAGEFKVNIRVVD